MGATGQLKTAIDRLEAIVGHAGLEYLSKKDTALLMTYRGGGRHSVQAWYAIFRDIVGCKDLGSVIGMGTQKSGEAKTLGLSIK